MKNLISRFTSSFAALLGDSAPVDAQERMDVARDAMLEALASHLPRGAAMPKLWGSIARATDMQSLWYLRSDLLVLLAEHAGERSAQRTLADITELFRGAVSDNQMPKANRFNR